MPSNLLADMEKMELNGTGWKHSKVKSMDVIFFGLAEIEGTSYIELPITYMSSIKNKR